MAGFLRLSPTASMGWETRQRLDPSAVNKAAGRYPINCPRDECRSIRFGFSSCTLVIVNLL